MEAKVDVENFLEKSLRLLGGGPLKVKDNGDFDFRKVMDNRMKERNSIIYIKYYPEERRYGFSVYVERT